MSDTLASLTAPVRTALGTLTARAQYGLVVLASLAGLYALTSLNDVNAQTRRALDGAQRQLSARQAALEQRDWAALAAEAENLTQTAEARFWRAPTAGIAAARIQGALEAAAREAGLPDARVQVIEADVLERRAPGAETRLFEAEVTARDTGGAFAPFIEAAAGAPGELRATRLDWDSRTRRFTVTFIAPAMMDPDS
ncbi:hypothetical protein [uncultured Maricaulis sp.]|uniref:hypothetical protein n=1 Tax=uncultured Maricaulis sp. TaxID=174710 RepID=UPI0030DCF816|tara:strand:- start:2297 stop:2887 length:591 start_codon:yes stop_codon:yes gene_type:complete